MYWRDEANIAPKRGAQEDVGDVKVEAALQPELDRHCASARAQAAQHRTLVDAVHVMNAPLRHPTHSP